MTPPAHPGEPAEVPRRRPGRPRLTEPSPEYRQRLEEIIETGTRVFHDRGYDSGSLDDVAAELGLRKASLYHYLRSKAQLLYFIFDRAITLALQQLDEMSHIADARQELATLIAHQVRMVADEPSLFAVFFDQRPRLDDAFEEEIRQKERTYVARIAAVVKRAVAAGDLPDVDPRHAAHALLGMTSWVYKWIDADRDDPDKVAQTMIRMVLGGPIDVPALLAAVPGSTLRAP
ncbi:TetR/AcrR family transcriptional regulator [Pseudonocardia bannensis]|uniref:TetR/AcrR family transcriptional regulator n=1 Tax=Pseudonocardia bannensis TaxID=630973 RepID=A0A848DK84_9PSEU|nr:TetR/AcrR family transcriptional regulator [Pseudonocardia bannensis]NMH93102.1 TetR/AcrR family transcriptional regulator [Pseudonocardia bannensis]